MSTEFSHPVILSHVPSGGRGLRLEASEAERAALAERLGLLSLQSLSAELQMDPGPQGVVKVTGRLRAALEQACGITLVPVRQEVDVPLAWRLLPEGMEPSDGEDDPDDLESERGVVDLGEALAQELSLVLDPYPRAPGAEMPELGDDAPHGPFAALLKLKRPE
ncbi:DUF177 domain-containing protein [Roseococcus sp. YIM B11640]|uniref:DUF177 domain-containing protein n=1 Tax=Roseococcus sp. YIM B11640 TaxID=3133973 RepID=UPI003C7B9A1F